MCRLQEDQVEKRRQEAILKKQAMMARMQRMQGSRPAAQPGGGQVTL